MASNGGNGDQVQNCVLEVFCGGDDRQERALARLIRHDLDTITAETVAHWIATHYDLAPKNSLYAFKQEIARLAKGPAYTD